MKLLRLEVQGFKSFKDKTLIHFDEGITGIVGPNGCGKSNIVDALFWVMGEQSAKHLRGSKMKDLIFAGSSKYNPANWAEVTLVLLNDNGKHIHIGNQVVKPQEIALTRKLYRNGETEYRINGIPARLKDIHEVFMDTGAGAKSYSIIAQGEINRLVQAKPQERRTMIEEVAGITKFKLRKRDSLKKIEHTQSNLNRLEDLQSEIYKNLKALERQAEKAEKAKMLKERIQRHELIVKSHKEFDYLSSYIHSTQFVAQKNEELERIQLEKNSIEISLEEERNQKVEITDKVNEMQELYNQQAKELAASEERIKHLRSSIEDKEVQAHRKMEELEEIHSDKEHRVERGSELEQQRQELEESNLEDTNFAQLEEEVEYLKDELDQKEESFQELERKLFSLRDEKTQIEQQHYRNSSKLEDYSKQLEETTQELEEIEKSSADFSQEVVENRKKLEDLYDKKEEAFQRKEQLEALLNEKKALFKETDRSLRELSKEVIQLESKRQSLIDLNKSGEGVRQGAINFLEQSESSEFNILGNLIECEPKYAKALEVLFESHFDALIAKATLSSEIASWSSSNSDESFDCILPAEVLEPCGPETAQRLSLKGLDNVIAIEDVLTINDADYSKALKTYFNGFYVVENLDMSKVDGLKDIKFKGLVSLDGKVYLAKSLNGSTLSVRSEDTQVMGIVQRNNLISELTNEYEEKRARLDQLEKLSEKLDEELDEMSSEFEECKSAFDDINHEYISLKSKVDSQESSFSTTNSRVEILKKRKQDLSHSRLELIENEEKLQKQSEEIQEAYELLSDEIENLREEKDELKSTFESKRSVYVEKQALSQSYQSQLNSLNSQLDDIANQLKRYDEKELSIKNEQEQLHDQIESAKLDCEELAQSNQQHAEELLGKEEELNYVKDELTSLLTSMQERENNVKKMTQTISQIEKALVEHDLKIKQIIIDEELLVKDIFERYQVDLRDSVALFLEALPHQLEGLSDISSIFVMETEDGAKNIEKVPYEFDKKFPAVVKESKEKYKRYNSDLNHLGQINWQAVEDYEKQKLRYSFLKDQENQLKTSLSDLQQAIEHIDEKSTQRFKTAFDEVNEKFTRVFPIIFGGGEARLNLVGDMSTDEFGIDIIAKPPGKKMQSINLMSGGEKAMTAVSLIFSIFLVKPSPFCLLDEVDAPLDDANVGRFNELLREMSSESQFILITHNKKTMELNDSLYGVTMQEPGVSKAVSVQLH